MEGSILEGLIAPEKCGGTPLHTWDQLQEIWTAMLMYRDWILADERSSGAEDGLLRKTQTEKKRRSGEEEGIFQESFFRERKKRERRFFG